MSEAAEAIRHAKSERRQRTCIVSVRLTPEELEALKGLAGNIPMSTYLRSLMLAEVPCEVCKRQPPAGFICSECGRANTTRKESS